MASWIQGACVSKKSGKSVGALSKAMALEDRVSLLSSGRRIIRLPGRKIAQARRVVESWKQWKPFCADGVFEQRLRELTIDEKDLIVATVMPVNKAIRTHVLESKLWDDYRRISFPQVSPSPIGPDGKNRTGFYRLVRPVIEHRLSAIRPRLEHLANMGRWFDAQSMYAKLEQVVIVYIEMLLTRTCLLELKVAKLGGKLSGATGEERFRNFLELLDTPTYARQLFDEYPVLLGVASVRVDFLCNGFLRLLGRLLDDRSSIESQIFDGRKLGDLEDVTFSQGDSHCEGETVAHLRFSTGESLIYKPRTLGTDIAFSRVVQWFNAHLVGDELRAVRSLNCGTHGWSEFVQHRELTSKGEFNSFFRKQGKFIALFYVLHAADLHQENVIACGADPIYVDLEALFHAPPSVHLMIEVPGAPFPAPATVLDSLILPVGWSIGDDKFQTDISVLGGKEVRERLGEAQTLTNGGSDEAQIVGGEVVLGISTHLPMFEGVIVSSRDHLTSLLDGFREVYELCARESDALKELLVDAFRGVQLRFVARPTALYGTLVHKSMHPDYMRDEMERRALFERIFTPATAKRWTNRLLASEMDDMARLDIPYFYRMFEDEHLFDSHRQAIEGVRFASPRAIMEWQLDRLGETDMQAQLRLIEASFLRGTQQAEVLPQPLPKSVSPLDEALAIGDLLLERMVSSHGDGYWMCQMVQADSVVVTSPGILDLYDGQLGIVLFLGFLAAVSESERFEKAAILGVDTLRRWTRHGSAGFHYSGVFNGAMGYVYVLSNLGIALKRRDLIDEAKDTLANFDLERWEEGLDVISGAAGCILFLCNLLQVSDFTEESESSIRRLIEVLARRLAESATRDGTGVSWRIPMAPYCGQTGFAHGNAGIAAALAACSCILDDSSYRDLAAAAISFENSQYLCHRGGWQDLRFESRVPDERVDMHAWCNGAPGIVLGRVLAMRAIQPSDTLHDTLANDLLRGLQMIGAITWPRNSSLCHGELGNGEITYMAHAALEKLGIALGIPAVHPIGASMLGRCCGDFARSPTESASAPPGLMTGIAGIGYALLRRHAPQIVPSVISLELSNRT